MECLDSLILFWYFFVLLSLLFLLWDLWKNTPMLTVMRVAWVLIILYTGPFGLFLYLLSCRQPLPNTHDIFIDSHWKQSIGSLMHCLAGDATGIILSAVIVYHFSLPNGIDLIIEYLSAFIVGLFVFQALFMLSMYENRYFLAVRKTFFAEFVSMNMVMVGMIPSMVILMHYLPEGNNPYQLTFWAIMSFATLVGGFTAYPINSWMVRKKLKHGMMTPHPMPQAKVHTEEMHSMEMKSSKEKPSSLSTRDQFFVILSTLVLLFIVGFLTSFIAPIHFS